jgi:putative transcriptional regulator
MNKEVILKQLGKRIREIRKEKGITQAQLAASVEKDQQSIQRLEVGNINPSFYYLCEIAAGLEIKVEELLKNIQN